MGCGGGGSRDYDVVPGKFASSVLAANSYDYYINERTPHVMAIDAVRLVYASPGSDPTRAVIYRGTDEEKKQRKISIQKYNWN